MVEPSGAGQVMADDLWPGQLQPAPFICSSLQLVPTRAGSCTGACMFVILSLHSLRLDFSAQLLMLTDSNWTVRLVADNYMKIKWQGRASISHTLKTSSRSSPHTKDKIERKHQWQQAPIMACSAVARLARACSWARFMSGMKMWCGPTYADLNLTWAQNSSFPPCSMSLVTTFLMALSTVTGVCVHFPVWIFWNLSMHKNFPLRYLSFVCKIDQDLRGVVQAVVPVCSYNSEADIAFFESIAYWRKPLLSPGRIVHVGSTQWQAMMTQKRQWLAVLWTFHPLKNVCRFVSFPRQKLTD